VGRDKCGNHKGLNIVNLEKIDQCGRKIISVSFIRNSRWKMKAGTLMAQYWEGIGTLMNGRRKMLLLERMEHEK
jgi:hypothetical protein